MSFYEKIKVNRDCNFHTLCLLDIRVKEQSFENLLKGNKIYDPPRFMTVRQAIQQLLETEECKQGAVYSKQSLCIGLARIGSSSQRIVSGPMEDLMRVDFGPPLHAIVIPARELHFIEQEMVDFYNIKRAPPDWILSDTQWTAIEQSADNSASHSKRDESDEDLAS